MAKSNHSVLNEFILVGLTENRELQPFLLAFFLMIYMISVVGNLGLIVLIHISPHLHTPMYFFLSHLAFVDFCYTSSITPNMLVNFMQKVKKISFIGCATQMCCFIIFVVCEVFLLSIMAYDHYVAICNPLLYTVVMSQKACIPMVASTYIYGLCVGILQTVVTFHLSFCASNVINHFYCDDIPLVALACSDTYIQNLLIFVFAGVNTLLSLLIVLVSYLFILLAILRIHSAKGKQKAFSTCASHMVSVIMFYGTVIFTYLKPKSSHALGTDKIASVFYTVMIPMLNPLIYSLRNKEVKSALQKVLGKVCSKKK
ncbi:olfactory receptor 5AL1-like isoform X2 [Antechinus flavipes]|uniref:olfactory receptor 5AL1-like isoform X2 n=1 Tax=Antechinus flavipes TaxID=38775 RepID=UPI00223601F8|nr:olfactory receptor 5AL1-like isoform X2 [Antechinus flavipes]